MDEKIFGAVSKATSLMVIISLRIHMIALLSLLTHIIVAFIVVPIIVVFVIIVVTNSCLRFLDFR